MIVKVSMVLNYHVDYSVYKEQCINQEKPELKCNGKCQLAKELKKTELNTPEKPELPSISFLQEVFIGAPSFSFSPPVNEIKTNEAQFFYTFHYSFGWTTNCWHPPKAI
jgi:hypothetical protein